MPDDTAVRAIRVASNPSDVAGGSEPVSRAIYRRSEHVPAFAVDHHADGTVSVVEAAEVDGALGIPAEGGVPLTSWLTDASPADAVLYREPEPLAAKREGRGGWTFLVGTETSVDQLRAEGAVATTCAGGLAAWRPEYATKLRDLDVVVTVAEGTSSTVISRVTETLGGIARTVRVLQMPCSAGEWFSSGRTVADLERLVLAAETASNASWPDPSPLRESPVPRFPVQVLPEWLEGYITAVTHDVQAPVDFAACWSLGALATAAGGLVDVELPTGHIQGVNLYIAVLAEPGTRKSAVHTAMTAPLAALEGRLAELTDAHRREAHADRVLAEKDLKDAETRLKSAVGEERDEARASYAAALEAAENAVVPAKPELSVGDTTPEALAVALWRQGGRYAIASAEANVFQHMTGLYGRDPNIDVYLQGYTNDPIQVRRGGFSSREDSASDARAEVHRPALTINVGGQPAVLHTLGRDGMLAKRGGLDRFCWIMPDDPVGSRETWPSRSSAHHRELYQQNLVDLGAQLWQSIPERHPTGEPVRRPTLVFSGSGAARMKTWLEDKEARLREGGDLRVIRGWAAKIDSFVARIAALIHLAERPSRPLADTAISEDTAAAALAIGDYLIAHAKRAMHADGDASQLDHARTIVEWIRRTGKVEFDRREAYTSINRFRKDADAIDAPLTFLVRRGWLREVEIEGSRVNRGFIVNPLTHHSTDA